MAISFQRNRSGPIRVLVVDDNFSFRMYLHELIGDQPDMKIVGDAANGVHALQRVATEHPDVVIMDVDMPGMDGLTAAKRLNEEGAKVKVILVTGLESAEIVRQASQAGVTKILRKNLDNRDGWREQLYSAIRQVDDHAGDGSPLLAEPDRASAEPGPAKGIQAVLIGASTGGPQAVATVLKGLPDGMPVPVLIVIHIAENFGQTLADWLARETGRPVRLARNEEPISGLAGQFLLAPEDHHMCIEDGRIILTQALPVHNVRPSVDVLFESAARHFGGAAVAVLLTGMGKDGASGLLSLRRRGAVTVAQDRKSSVVFGMPGAAVDLGAAGQVLSVERIAPIVTQSVQAHQPM